MDLKAFYRQIREAEARIAADFVVVVSNTTPDGGRAGVMSEVSRSAAARLMVEGKAALASEEQIREFRAENAQVARRAEERSQRASRLQVAVMSSPKPGK